MTVISLPQYHDLMWPVLNALKELGGSGTVQEIYDQVIGDEQFTEEQQSVSTRDGRMSQIAYRLHWARTHLKGIGAISNSSRGVWAITEKGQHLGLDGVLAEVKEWRGRIRASRMKRSAAEADEGGAATDREASWRDELIDRLLSLSAQGFERLTQRLLREAGFVNVVVMGRTGDGGIDGVGVYRLSLVSFPLYFQCKRYRGTVGSTSVRDFRGAMAGRGEKGLLVTTGSFTKDAAAEASRDGAPPVELIDGDRLCDLLKEYRLGVMVTQRVEEDVSLEAEFFARFE